jgi:serine/threonine protein kinase
MINTTISKYKITRLIGQGGMATVYEAEHEMLGTKAAIKVLNPILSANDQIRERFRNEAKMMASLDHPNITKVIDFDEQPQQLSIIMEFLNGEDLNDMIKRKGALSENEILNIFTQTLSACQYAHEKGIVHRDIKPSNIFILPNGHVKILDFGIAKLFGQGNEMTQTGAQMGTPIYMSPEQVKADKSIDHRSDIYSLGVTMFYAINGKPPYNAETDSQFDIFTKIVYEPLPEFSVQSKFNALVLKACKKDRQDRFQSCEEWEVFINHEFISSLNDSFDSDLKKLEYLEDIIAKKNKYVEDLSESLGLEKIKAVMQFTFDAKYRESVSQEKREYLEKLVAEQQEIGKKIIAGITTVTDDKTSEVTKTENPRIDEADPEKVLELKEKKKLQNKLQKEDASFYSKRIKKNKVVIFTTLTLLLALLITTALVFLFQKKENVSSEHIISKKENDTLNQPITKTKNDWTELGLKGKVLSCTEIYFGAEARFGKIKKGEWNGEKHIYFFNINGNKNKEEYFSNQTGGLNLKEFYQYNNKGKIIERISFDNNGKLRNKETFKYDEKDTLIEDDFYDENGKLVLKSIYHYDPNANRIADNYSSNGNLCTKSVNQYDLKGNLLVEILYDSTGSTIAKDTYQYDKDDNLFVEIHYYSHHYFGDKLVKRINYKYSNGNNLIEEKFFDEKGSILGELTYKYEFDKYGNWIKQISFLDGKPSSITERILKYFE